MEDSEGQQAYFEHNAKGIGLELRLSGLPEHAYLEVRLRNAAWSWDLAQLLDEVFPPDGEGQAEVEESFDLYENPDIVEIYRAFTGVLAQFRRDLCRLEVTAPGGSPAAPDTTVGRLFHITADFGQEGDRPLSLSLSPRYSALEYGRRMGWDTLEQPFFPWLQECLAMYFIDKHEQSPALCPGAVEPGDAPCSHPACEVMSRLGDMGLLSFASPGGESHITQAGRGFIGRLLRETEDYIDRYDIFKDVLWEEETGAIEFGTGAGDDLRVEVYLAEGLDPLRTVFLLRLYDGTCDPFVDEWQAQVGRETFFDEILEPVVNRCVSDEEIVRAVLEQGYAILEDAAESERESRRLARITSRANSSDS